MKFIAHRGFSRRFAENSLPAFQEVIDHPCNGSSLIGIELDIHLTGDDKIPVMHETTVEGSNGEEIPVAQCTFDGLQRLFRQEHGSMIPPVPEIEEVLDLVGYRTELCFEIKERSLRSQSFLSAFCRSVERLSAVLRRGRQFLFIRDP